jgi:hypothetical protein
MSSPFDFPGGGGGAAGVAGGYSAPAPPVYYRHPLGLPQGSVRALLTFMVLGTVWALLLMPAEKGKVVEVPLYLTYLMFLVIGSYFGSRSSVPKTKGQRESPPLYLPRGTIRLFIILGFLGVCGYGVYRDHTFFTNLKFDIDAIQKEPYLPLVVFGAYFLGTMVSTVAGWVLMGDEGMPAWYMDIQAWVAVLAVLALTGGVIYQLIIFPTMDASKAIDLREKLAFPWQSSLSGIVAFYFGAR